jgi:hypothetical protein
MDKANSDINDRVWKRHGRWKSDSSKDGYVVDSVDKRLQVSTSLHKKELTSSKRKNPAKLNTIMVRSLTTNKSLFLTVGLLSQRNIASMFCQLGPCILLFLLHIHQLSVHHL